MNEHSNLVSNQLKNPFSGAFTRSLEWIGKLSDIFSSQEKVVNLGQETSLKAWVSLYYKTHVIGAPFRTQQAKQRDLEQFIRFFIKELGHDGINSWTPSVTKLFQESMVKAISVTTGKTFSQTTINRTMSTLRHFGRWLQQQKRLLTGDPFKGVKERQVDELDWRGLTPKQVESLKMACEARIKACERNDQNPLLETTVFYMLLQTGLRESELVALNIGQYYHEGLHQVVRHKNKRISARVPVPSEARQYLERYLEKRGKHNQDEPLFLSRYGNRLATQDVRRICQRLLKEVIQSVNNTEEFRFTPHMLRHTFLKRVTDLYGIHFAQQMSGNVSVREIFRYAKPSQQEIDYAVERLFD